MPGAGPERWLGTRRILLVVSLLLSGMLFGVATPVAADDGPPGCEPLVLAVTINWTTIPPTVSHFVWIRPECLET